MVYVCLPTSYMNIAIMDPTHELHVDSGHSGGVLAEDDILETALRKSGDAQISSTSNRRIPLCLYSEN